ncbi:MAG TPA: hypothetical protein VLB46_17985 [Pyrinomonadaceae bacterium]|nr:hypothetical protein [Pyrinomonadaceae bacterium]
MSVLRVIALILGSILICSATLLYEDQERKLQSKLEELWIRIRDREERSISVHVAFMQVVADVTNSALNRILGRELVSLQSVGVSLCYSYASFLMLLLYFDRHVVLERSVLFDNIVIAFYVLLGTFPLFNLTRRTLFLRLWFLIILVSFVFGDLFEYWFILEYTWSDAIGLISETKFFYVGLLIGIGSDVLFIMVLRRLLRYGGRSTSLPKLIAIAGIFTFCILVLFLGPIVYETRSRSFQATYASETHFTIWVAVTSNLCIALIGATVVLLGVMLMVHKAFWPMLDRPLYALQRLGINRRKVVLRWVGSTLLGFSIGGEQLAQIVTSFIALAAPS